MKISTRAFPLESPSNEHRTKREEGGDYTYSCA